MKEFLWGASLSSHQVEGGLENDWTRWEQKHASEWASESLLDKVVNKLTGADPPDSASDPEMYLSGEATDHYNRYKRDIEIADEIGINALRLSLEWSRIQPAESTFSQDAIDHYRTVIRELKRRDITPVITIWHYSHPQWFVDNYGWHHEDAPGVFARYVKKVITSLGDDVDFWITMNEPMGYLRAGYIGGGFPPENTRRRDVPAVYRHLVTAHKAATEIIDEHTQSAKHGISVAAGCFEPYTDNPLNEWLSERIQGLERDRFLNRIQTETDWFGINYYYHYKVDVLLRNHLTGDQPRSDMGWPLSPTGLYKVVKRTEQYGNPVIVTEHGLADRDDDHRDWYIRESINQLERAINDGVDLNGYFHWALTDNFEWGEGFWPRFGLAEVDYDDLSRQLRDSADTYGDLIDDRDWTANW